MRHIVAAAFLATAGLVTFYPARGQTPAPEAKPAVFKLPPAAEKKLKAAVEKFTDIARRQCDQQAEEDMADLTRAANPSPEQIASLKVVSKTAAEKSVTDFVNKLDEGWRNAYESMPDQFETLLDTIIGTNVDLDEMMSGDEPTRPSEQDSWKKALDQILSEEQKAAWKRVFAARTPVLDAETEKYLTSQEDHLRVAAEGMVGSAIGNVTQNLPLSKERLEALDALAASAVKASVQAQRKEIAEQISKMDAKQRAATIKQRNSYYTIQENKAPEKQPVWTEGIAKLLTDDERATLKNLAGERQKRRVQAYIHLFVSLLDEKVAFTAAQRERLLPLVEKAVAKSPALLKEQSPGNYYNISTKTFYLAAGDAPQQEVKTILDSIQWEHWQALHESAVHPPGDGSDDQDGMVVIFNRPKPPPKAAPSPTPLLEPDEVDCAVSDFLADKTARQRKSSQERLTLEAEDFTRVASLTPEAAATLRLAALGAAEEETNSYKINTESMIQGQIGGARPENIRQKLAGIQSYYFMSRRSSTPLNKLPFWTQTVNQQTTAEQRSAWEEEKSLRDEARCEAIASIVAVQFDREVIVSPAQWKAIKEKIFAVVKEYRTELDNSFSYSSGTPWYLQTYSAFIPLAGIPEAEMKALLDKRQMDSWSRNDGFSNAESYWENIKANHERSKKAATK